MKKFCDKCGGMIDEATGRCSYCDIIDQKTKKLRKKKIGIVCASLATVALVSALAVFGYIKFFKPESRVPGADKPEETQSEALENTEPDVTENSPVTEKPDVDDPVCDGGQIFRIENDTVFRPDIDAVKFDSDSNIAYFNNVIMVYAFSELDDSVKDELCEAVDGEIVGDISGTLNTLQIKIEESTLDEIEEMSESLMEFDEVLFAGYDYPVEFPEDAIDSDPWSDDRKNPDAGRGNEGYPDGNDWWAEAIGAYTAWDNIKPEDDIKIGIVDSGFDTDHEDLKGKIEFPDSHKENSAEDHGTHVAGLICAKNNRFGIRGVADHCSLVCVDMTPDGGYVYMSSNEYIAIIKNLMDSGVRVVNNSWGLEYLSEDGFNDRLLEDTEELMVTLEYFGDDPEDCYDSYTEYTDALAERSGTDAMLLMIQLLVGGRDDFFMVQAAGNGYDGGGDGLDTAKNGYYCTVSKSLFNDLSRSVRDKLKDDGITFDEIDKRILVVGAVANDTSNGDYYMTYYSNYGENLDICAPGDEIYSTLTDGEYGYLSGTSMASPLVAGSVAAIWSEDGDMSVDEVREKLFDGCVSEVGVLIMEEGETTAYCSYPVLNIGCSINGKLDYDGAEDDKIAENEGTLDVETVPVTEETEETEEIIGTETVEEITVSPEETAITDITEETEVVSETVYETDPETVSDSESAEVSSADGWRFGF